MTSLTWNFNKAYPLIACGIDLEKIDRFSKWAGAEGEPPAFVFSREEVDFNRSLADPALGLCASFCCKEAVLKALGEPYNYTGCEMFLDSSKETLEVHLHEDLRAKFVIKESIAVFRKNPLDENEIIVAAYLFGDAGSGQ